MIYTLVPNVFSMAHIAIFPYLGKKTMNEALRKEKNYCLHVKYVSNSFSELRKRMIASRSAKWPRWRVLFEKHFFKTFLWVRRLAFSEKHLFWKEKQRKSGEEVVENVKYLDQNSKSQILNSGIVLVVSKLALTHFLWQTDQKQSGNVIFRIKTNVGSA